MSTTTSIDPVQTVLDLLNAATAGDWSNAGGTPSRIARSSEYPQSDKAAYEAGDAIYVYVSGGEGIDPEGTDTFTEQFRVSCDLWTLNGEDRAHAIARDIQDILNDYWTDNSTATNWTTVRPFDIQDYRHETFADFGQHDRLLVESQLMRLDDTS